MPSPFPGFDPYLENPRYWRAVHAALIIQVYEKLNRSLPPGFIATVEERIYLLPADKGLYPDVLVLSVPPLPLQTVGTGGAAVADPSYTVTLDAEETVERYVEVRLLGEEEETIAVIEVLSPTNKTSDGYGREAYVNKQRQILRGGAHLLEIDLLRRGLHAVAVPQIVVENETRTGWDYLTCLHRAGAGTSYEFWPTTVHARLPRVAVPLTENLPDVVLDLQSCFDHVYDTGPFHRRVNYKQPADPPLVGQDALWADALLREKGCADVKDVWDRFETWLAANAPQVLETLPPGATDDEIRLTEETLGVTLPDDFKASCRIHNGSGNGCNLAQNGELLSLERVSREWNCLQTISEEYEPWINSNMVPLARDSDYYFCLDLAPERGGRIAQVVALWEYDWTYSVVADGFKSWFVAFVEACEAGLWAYSEKHGSLMKVEIIEDDW